MLAPALQYQHYIRHLDVTTAFLCGDLEEVVYMAPPDGVIIPRKRKRKNHIDIKYHFLKELVSDGKIKIVYVPITQQIADGLTKSLPRPAHKRYVASLGLKPGNVEVSRGVE